MSEPCRPHKISRQRCATCEVYEPVAERILIVKLGAMGDVLRTTCCLPPLKARYPRSHITWVTRSNARPLLERNVAVDRVLTIEGNYLELLMCEEFDLVIGPDADVLSASIVSIARAGEKRGYVADGRGGVQPLSDAALAWWLMGTDDTLKQENRRTYGEWLYAICALPTPIGAPTLSVGHSVEERAMTFLGRHTAGAAQRVCFNTGSGSRWREKRWKASHFSTMARLVADKVVGTVVVLVGGPDEAEFNRDLAAQNPDLVDAGTDCSVETLAALMAGCDWVLTADSLGYHVATAVGTPAVCLVGPTAPWELDRYGRNLVLYSKAACIACYRASCPLPFSCMDALTPAKVCDHVYDCGADPSGRVRIKSGLYGVSVEGLPELRRE